jgi:hypothetical protein
MPPTAVGPLTDGFSLTSVVDAGLAEMPRPASLQQIRTTDYSDINAFWHDWKVDDMYTDNPDFNAKFENSFGALAFTANRHLMEHMIRVQRDLGVDYETLVIWGILAHLNIAHLFPPGKISLQIEIDNAMKDPKTGMKPLRLRDLEQVTGLPRETIRRKLGRLQARNYILQTGDGWIINRDAVDQNMREFTRITILRLLETANTIHTLLQHNPAQPSAADAP